MAVSLAGKLLVATPGLLDPNFYRAVVLMCEHSDEGALGVVLNRPLEDALVEELLPEWRDLVSDPAVLFTGGPVEPSSAIALGQLAGGRSRDGWTPVTGRAGLLSLSHGSAEYANDLERLRIFSGYAGWGGGQIERELKEEAWFVVDSDPADVFTSEPDRLWRAVLRRQPGQLAMFAYFPDDPRAN